MAAVENEEKQNGIDNSPQKHGLPSVILGAMEFGRRLTLEESTLVTNKFAESGFNEIDTAFVYNDGDSERFVEKILSKQENEKASKNSMLIATKLNPLVAGGLSKQGIEFQLNTSLKRLNTQCIDLLYLHWPDYNVKIEETLECLNKYHKEKKFNRFGLSNFPAWQVANIYYICKEKNYGFIPTVYQGMYNPLTRDVESELMPCLKHFGIKFYAFNILAGGLLTGKYESYDLISDCDNLIEKGRFHGKDNVAAKRYRNRFWKISYFNAIHIIKQVLEKEKKENNVNISLIEASLRWMQHHSMLTNNDGVILGASSSKHFDENLKALTNDQPLPDSIVKAFDSAWNICKKDVPSYFKDENMFKDYKPSK